MPIILILILTLPLASPQLFSSPLLFTLTSSGHSKDIPPTPLCSCQLAVFPVYGDRYSLKVQNKQTSHTWVRIKIESSQVCLVSALDESKSASFGVNSTNFNGYEITQRFWVELYTPDSQGNKDCSQIQSNGDRRVVYLVNRTREESQGEYQYIINIPKNAIAVTQGVSFLLLLLLCHNIKYRRFTPFRFNFAFVLIYAIFLFATIYLDTYFDWLLDVAFWIAFVFSFVCMIVYFVDITSIFLNKTAAIISVSLFLTLLIALIQVLVLPDAWPLNDLIATFVAGALIKFVVVKKLKQALLPLLFLWIFFIFRQFMVFFHFQNFEQALHIKIVPLFLQLPAMLGDDQDGFACSAFGTSKIITMGLVFNYCVRVDLFLSTRFYTILSSIIALCCFLIQYLILLLVDQLPVLEYTSVIVYLPVSFALILLMSSKRGEWAELWHGSFHDMAVDRKSIKREADSLLDYDELDRSLEQLKMNNSSESAHD